jgi:DnaJ domain
VNRTNVIDGVGALSAQRAPTPHTTVGPAGKARCPQMIDAYGVLEVSPTATQGEITRAYRQQLRDCHPDRRAGEPNYGADERLRQILAAYAMLRDPHRRADYDRVHHVPKANPEIPIRINQIRPAGEVEPSLWVGPVRWHR